MQAHEVDFINLIQGEKQFRVPLYQRPYSWGTDQLQQLWNDIRDEAERTDIEAPHSGHFIGSVVLAPSPTTHAGGLSTWLVVDGQQRLTSLMLALAAIRDHLRADNPQTAERIDEQYLTNRWRQGDDRLRLLPTQADRDAYRSCLLGTPGEDSGDGIAAAYRWFRAQLEAVDDPNDPDDIPQLELTIRTRLRLVEITAERGDNVHRIFESLNNTGLDLSQADLIRNHIFMLLPERGENVYRDWWLPMQRRIGAALEELLWLDLILRGDEKAKQADTHRSQIARLRPLEHDEAAIEAQVEGWARLSVLFATVLAPELESDPEVRVRLERLDEWGGQTWHPVALWFLTLRQSGKMTSSEVAQGLLYIESFLVRRMLLNTATNNLNRVLNAVPRELADAEAPADAFRGYLSGARRYWPTDDQIRDAVTARPFYWQGRSPQRTFVLRRLEEAYGSPEPADWTKGKFSIEHVLPQTLTAEWEAELADFAAREQATVSEVHDAVVHTLGNLTLTASNSKLSNHPFQRKQDLLVGSALLMNQEIAKSPHWGADEIITRGEKLAEIAVTLWPGPERGKPIDESWSALHRILALVPAGAWTTYGDLAEVTGSHPVPIGQHLATRSVVNAWRVLNSEGKSSPQFRWTDPSRSGPQQEALELEGVPFDASGRAAASHRLAAVDLARMAGLDVSDERPALHADVTDPERCGQFETQLADAQNEATVIGVRRFLEVWGTLDGYLGFGDRTEVSCFPLVHFEGLAPVWFLAIYPQTGTAEVVFQHLSKRHPFDDPGLCRELRDRLDAIPGVDLPLAKLQLRPSFRLETFANPEHVATIEATAEWFIETVREAAP